MTDNYQKLREVIIAANPSIMELEFGCETDLGTFISEDPEDEVMFFSEGDGAISSIVNIRRNNLKILGREISLADVVHAIKKKQVPIHIKSNLDKNLFWLAMEWDCLNDSLSWHKEHQPETVEWLIELLVK